jgi:threonine aldolase
MPELTPEEIGQIRRSCTRQIAHHVPLSVKEALQELLSEVGPEEQRDSYGTGAIISEFEAHVAKLLGKDAAVFVPSGTMAQQIALRIWCDGSGVPRVAYHPSSHLHLHEQQALVELHRLDVCLVGDGAMPLTASDLEAIDGPLGAVLIELPQRELGGVLPLWSDLQALVAAAKARGAAVHLDGARLWEAAPFYDRSVADIAALFDSVYVSFYKGLGGVAGAVLAGPADHIDAARIWQRRHGGNLVALWPYVVSARRSLAERLDRMPAYVARMRAFADAVRDIDGIAITPDPPHCNMAHIRLEGDLDALTQASIEVSRDAGIWVGQQFTREGGLFELTIGDAGLQVTPAEFRRLYTDIVQRAVASPG